MARLRRQQRQSRALALLERIALAPRQSLALVEAEGRRILVATSAEGGPAFYPLDDERGNESGAAMRSAQRAPAEGFMVAAWRRRLAAAAPAAVPLLPDLNAKLHPFGLDAVDDSLGSDADHVAARDPDGDDAAGAAAGGLSLPAPGAGHADRALESHADGAGADDDVVPDDAGAQSGRPAGRGALSRRADYGHRGHRPRRAAGEAFPAASMRAKRTWRCLPPQGRFRGPTRRTTCPCG